MRELRKSCASVFSAAWNGPAGCGCAWLIWVLLAGGDRSLGAQRGSDGRPHGVMIRALQWVGISAQKCLFLALWLALCA
eukprot:2771500-Prymnesium_polylepis.1